MKPHRVWVVGFALGLVLANCSKPDPKTLNGTALYVNNLFATSKYQIRQLQFVGQNTMGNDVFQSDFRPTPASTTDLSSPQTVRILLSDSLAGTDVVLTVYAIDANGENAEYGTSTVKVVLGTETDVTVNMKPFEVADAGSDGGVDAGRSFDASLPDGGVATCSCNQTCCVAGAPGQDGGSCAVFGTVRGPVLAGLPPFQISFLFCGPPKTFCDPNDFCHGIRSDTCISAPDGGSKCSCGNQGDCPPGTRCLNKGPGAVACTCDVLSNCDGCCGYSDAGNPKCFERMDLTPAVCGAAGLACDKCPVSATCTAVGFGVGACSNVASNECISCIGVNKCCSATKCLDAGFPTCRQLPPTKGGSACDSCEFGRSDRCSPITGGCACGIGKPCEGFQFCTPLDDGGAFCQ